MDAKDLITEEVPVKNHYTVVEISNGNTYTIEADSVEELYKKIDELERRANSEGLTIVK